jgi:peroxiredoxin
MTTDLTPLVPGQPAPELIAPLIDGGLWRLHDQTPRCFLLVVVYRGHHCGACRKSLEAWNAHAGALEKMGVEAVFVSADSRDRALASRTEWDVPDLTLAYGWDLAQARRWGLYVSDAIKESEPDQFLEPALFVLDPDFKIYSVNVQSNQFARPHAADVVAALEFIIEKDYPPRGAVAYVEDRSADLDVDLDEAAGG